MARTEAQKAARREYDKRIREERSEVYVRKLEKAREYGKEQEYVPRTPEEKVARLAYERKRREDPEIHAKQREEKRMYNQLPHVQERRQKKWQDFMALPPEDAKRRKRAQVKSAVYYGRYGITLEQREEFLQAQDGKCQLPHCRMDISFARGFSGVAHLDHCHVTGRIRGVLCGGCNTALGRLGDTIENLTAVLAYLKGEL